MKSAQRKRKDKKYFTLDEANAMLPLLTAVLRDITALARDLQQRHEHLTRLQHSGLATEAHRDEIETLVDAFERDQARMQEFEDELRRLNVELKDYFTGLIDFPCWKDDREIYLCWRLGEPEVAHWHELDTGFAGRRQIENAQIR